ncbi:hypothetical protein [Granulicoccus sp. GXG6511]|uniref:hypothetical protein n=1 Tax=Granulicoccus sp. GXG6511 TaxID=3381351 RepID=UPI003D7F00E0
MPVTPRSAAPGRPAAPMSETVLPALAWRAGLTLTLLTALVLLLSEIDRLSGQIPAVLDGRIHPFSELVGPRPSAAAWSAVLTSPTRTFWQLLCAHVVVDSAFVGAYAGLARWLARGSRVATALLVTAVFDLGENVLIALTWFARRDPVGAGPLVAAIMAFTALKWLAALGAAILAFRGLQRRWPDVRAWLGTARFAVRIQRFGALLLAILVLLSLVPRDGVFDQLPDVQRSWPESAAGWLQFGASVAVLLVMAAALFVMGRLRTQHLLDEQARGRRARPAYPLLFWLIGPVVLWVLALAQPHDVLWDRLGLVTGGLAAIALISFVLRQGRQPPWLEPTRALGRDRIHAAARLGDLLAIGAIAASGVGLARAFIGPLVLGLSPAISAGLTLFGLVAALGAWPVAARLIDRLHASRSTSNWRHLLIPGEHTTWGLRTAEGEGDAERDGGAVRDGGRVRKGAAWRKAVIPVASFVTGLAMLAVAGLPGLGVIGVSATVLLGTGIIALFVGGMVVLGQDLRPPEALERLGFRTTPVVLLLITILLITNLSPASTRIHGLRQLADPVPDRPDLQAAFNSWLAATAGCGRESADGVRWRPMLLYAAEGGGIRAAYWTARGIDLIGDADPRCAAAFLSGGASGGAVGLTVAQVTEPGRAADAVTELSRSQALAQASLGMFLRDVLRAGTGLPLTLGTEGWQDRAALIEQSWEQAVPALASAYLPAETPDSPDAPGSPDARDDLDQRAPADQPEPTAQPGPTASNPPGQLVLNTTAVSSGCRTYLSQITLPTSPTPLADARPGDCDGDQVPGGRSVDFFAESTAHCVEALRASTVALTASRFPYVTPAAAIGCPGGEIEQLVDGGYVENTGLGTILDLWPAVSSLVEQHNETAAGSGQDLVVPMVVYLTNSPGADLAPPGRPVTEELLVPPVAYLRASGAQNSPSALLQRLRGATGDFVVGTPQQALPQRRVFVVYPATRPALTAPLGWTLSEMSRASMDDALAQQENARCGNRGVPDGTRRADRVSAGLICERGYGTLGDLVGALRG